MEFETKALDKLFEIGWENYFLQRLGVQKI